MKFHCDITYQYFVIWPSIEQYTRMFCSGGGVFLTIDIVSGCRDLLPYRSKSIPPLLLGYDMFEDIITKMVGYWGLVERSLK